MWYINNVDNRCDIILMLLRGSVKALRQIWRKNEGGFFMKGINKVIMVISKVLEILHWVGSLFMAAVLVCSITAKDWLANHVSDIVAKAGDTISTYGFELKIIGLDNNVNITAIMLFSITAVIVLNVSAMVWRNIYLILKTAKGKTWFSNGKTPFQKDIIRMVREIGIFYILIPVVGLIMSIISRIVLGVDVTEAAVDMGDIITGILVLCLTQVFSYGAELQEDVNGLL